MDSIDPEVVLREHLKQGRKEDGNRKSAFTKRRDVKSILPPIPPRFPIVTDEHDAQFRGNVLPLPKAKLVRTLRDQVEHVYNGAKRNGELRGLYRSREALRVWKHAYTYLLDFMSEQILDAIGDGILTCRASKTQEGFYRTDLYNDIQTKADVGMDQFNSVYGSVIDDLQLFSLDANTADRHMELVDQLPNRFPCLVVTDDGNAKVLCLSDHAESVDQWLLDKMQEEVTSGAVRTAERLNGDGKSSTRDCFFIGGKCCVSIQTGDITKLCVDVVVNPSNKRLNRTDGLSGAITAAAGPLPAVACYNYVKKHGLVAPTKAITTAAGNLPCKYLLHVVLPPSPGELVSKKTADKHHRKIAKMFTKMLRKLDKKKITSAAVPLMVDEIGGVSPNKTLSILTLVLAKYKIRNHTHRHYLNLYLVDSKEQNSQKMLHFMENQMSKSEQSKKYRTIQRLEMSTETLKKINPYM